MTEVLSDVIWQDEVPYMVPIRDSGPLADAMTATGELLRSFHTEELTSQQDLFAAAEAAVEACMAATAEPDHAGRDVDEGTVTASESILLSLHRILRAVRPAS
jgi:hypothetical protein